MGGATTRRTWRFLRTTFMTATFAAIDVGTNSTNLLVIDGNGTELTRVITSTRLGEGEPAIPLSSLSCFKNKPN